MRTLVLLTLAALILAAGTVALWSRTAHACARFEDLPLLHDLGVGTVDARLTWTPGWS